MTGGLLSVKLQYVSYALKPAEDRHRRIVAVAHAAAGQDITPSFCGATVIDVP